MSVRLVINHTELRQLLVSENGDVAKYTLRLGILVQTQARRNCPVDTGRLRSSISVSQRASPGGAVTSVGTDVEYAKFVHDGYTMRNGVRYPGRPFLTDAVQTVLSQSRGR